MLGLDVRRPELTGLIPREKDHAPRLLRIAFEHVPPSPIGKYTRPKQRAGCAACDLLPRFRLLAKAEHPSGVSSVSVQPRWTQVFLAPRLKRLPPRYNDPYWTNHSAKEVRNLLL